MKNLKVVIIAATCFLSFNLLSQNVDKSNRIVQYGYFGINGGHMFGIGESYMAPSITIGFKKGFEFYFDHKLFDVQDPNSENFYIVNPLFISAYDNQGTNGYITSFNIGKSLFESEKMRVVLSAGPSFIKLKGYEASGVNILFIGSNTNSQTFERNTTGIDIKAKLDITAAEVVGTSLILNCNFNEFENYYSAGLAFTFGMLK